MVYGSWMVVINPCNRLLLNDAGGPSGYDGTNWIPNKVMCSFQASSPTVLTTIKISPHDGLESISSTQPWCRHQYDYMLDLCHSYLMRTEKPFQRVENRLKSLHALLLRLLVVDTSPMLLWLLYICQNIDYEINNCMYLRQDWRDWTIYPEDSAPP